MKEYIPNLVQQNQNIEKAEEIEPINSAILDKIKILYESGEEICWNT